MRRGTRASVLLPALFVAICLFVGGCGYTLQTKADLPFEAISLGRIGNRTTEPKLQDQFNRLLAETLSEYGFLVTRSARYSLEGEVRQFLLKPSVELSSVATQYQVIIRASFRLVDRETGRVTPVLADSPYITYFNSVGKLESVLAQKELSSRDALKNLSQAIVMTIIYSVPANFSPLLLTVQDIRDPEGLVLALKAQKDPLSRYIMTRFSEELRQEIENYDSSGLSDAFKGSLTGELNSVLQGASLYERDRFASVALTGETRDLAAREPKSSDRVLLNRLLLQEAYPDKIAPYQQNHTGGKNR
ncbi:MAG: LPS assembly lipoprotein LptE [Thermodesulfovibrionales bacterium]